MSQSHHPGSRQEPWAFVERVAEPALALAPRDYLDNIRANVAAYDIPDAVAERDTPWIVNWLVGFSQYQGISDANAAAYTAKHGMVPRSDTRRYTFVGFKRCCYLQQSFQSDDERRFAVLIDADHEKDVLRLVKPERNQFMIDYRRGERYEPDSYEAIQQAISAFDVSGERGVSRALREL